jgi:hypothetical protein
MDYGLQPGKPEHEVQSLQKSSDRNENISLEPLVVWERDSSQLAGNNCILIVDVSIGQPVCFAVCTATERSELKPFGLALQICLHGHGDGLMMNVPLTGSTCISS